MSALALVAAAGCGPSGSEADPRLPPPVAARTMEPIAGDPTPATVGAPRAPGPSAPTEPEPTTITRARELAREERWLESATIYGAVFDADPTDARALAGRGFALLHIDGELAAARADLERARGLAADDERLVSTIDHNFGLVAAREAGEDAVAPPVGCRGTQVVEVAGASVADLVAVVMQIRGRSPDDWGADDPLPEDVPSARLLLCGTGACPESGPFIASYAPADMFAAHLVVPLAAGGFALYADVTPAGMAGRCSDGGGARIVPAPYGRTEVHAYTLRNSLDEICDANGAECLEGCLWENRVDFTWVVSADGLHALAASRRIDVRGPERARYDPPWAGARATHGPTVVRFADCPDAHAITSP